MGAEQRQEPTLDSVHSACIIFSLDWLQEEFVKFPVSQFLAVGRTALASQSAALYSAKLATVESRDQMAANILAAAGLKLNPLQQACECERQVCHHCLTYTAWAQLSYD